MYRKIKSIQKYLNHVLDEFQLIEEHIHHLLKKGLK